MLVEQIYFSQIIFFDILSCSLRNPSIRNKRKLNFLPKNMSLHFSSFIYLFDCMILAILPRIIQSKCNSPHLNFQTHFFPIALKTFSQFRFQIFLYSGYILDKSCKKNHKSWHDLVPSSFSKYCFIIFTNIQVGIFWL